MRRASRSIHCSREGPSHRYVLFVLIGARRKHEEDCMYKQVQCPNNEGHCGMFRTPDLEQHLRVCMQVPCVNRELGNYNSY